MSEASPTSPRSESLEERAALDLPNALARFLPEEDVPPAEGLDGAVREALDRDATRVIRWGFDRILGRAADAGGLEAYQALYRREMDKARKRFAQALCGELWTSEEADGVRRSVEPREVDAIPPKYRDEVDEIYLDCVGRHADPGGLKHYGSILASGKADGRWLRRELQASPEGVGFGRSKPILRRYRNIAQQNPMALIPGAPIVKFVGVLGSSGYAIATRLYVTALVRAGVNVLFEPCALHQLSSAISEEELMIARCMGTPISAYDTLIVHSVPDCWAWTVPAERARNPELRVIGLTVWETDTIPADWKPHLALVDEIAVPCAWNVMAMRDSEPGKPVHLWPHAIVAPPQPIARLESQEEQAAITVLRASGKLIVLVVGQWSARKGIARTIEVFRRTFTAADRVVLYCKTFMVGHTDDERQRIEHWMGTLPAAREGVAPPEVIIDGELRSEEFMNALYHRADVFFSLCCAEGVGLGACTMAFLGKPVVITGGGGSEDYMRHAFKVQYELSDVMTCNEPLEDHSRCSDAECAIYRWYGRDHKWPVPSLEHAGQRIRWVCDNVHEARARASASAGYMQRHFSYEAVGRQIRGTLRGGRRAAGGEPSAPSTPAFE